MVRDGNEPFARKQCEVVVDLDAPIERAFAAGTSEVAMMQWAPFPRSVVYDHSKAVEPYGVGSERLVTTKSGVSVLERIIVSERPSLLVYTVPSFGSIADRMIRNYASRMTFEELGPKRTRLTWAAHFDCPGVAKIVEPLIRMAMKQVTTGMARNLRKYLAHSDSRV